MDDEILYRARIWQRWCALAARMAANLRREPGIEIVNDVVLNQVLVRCRPPN